MLGGEAAESMIDWLDALEVHHDDDRRAVRAEMGALRAELRAEMVELRQEMAELRGEMRDGFAEMRVGFAAVDTKLAQRNATS